MVGRVFSEILASKLICKPFERTSWSFFLLRFLTFKFSLDYSTDYYSIGNCFLFIIICVKRVTENMLMCVCIVCIKFELKLQRISCVDIN